MGCDNLDHSKDFSSTNQPDPKLKRVPKYKTRFLKAIKENWDTFKDKMSKGDRDFWKMAIEQAFGKPDQRTENKEDINITEVPDININIIDANTDRPS